MVTTLWVAGALLVCLGLLPVLATLRFRKYVLRYLNRESPQFRPPLTVIVPCKGIDPGFDKNIKSLLDQDYPDFEILFVTATSEEPAHARLKKVLSEHSDANARLLVAGIESARSQKLNNQLRAYSETRAETEALVFVDSDIRPHPHFLQDLVAPLVKESVGATTGFRWYIPEGGGAASYIRAAWNAGGLPVEADPNLAYAWGGAMAILRKTFERARIPERWANALTDDFPLTLAVRELGMSVRFVPTCLVGSHEDATWKQLIEWTNRQTIISRVYNPALWTTIFSFHAVHAIGMLVAFSVLVARGFAAVPAGAVWPALLILSTVFLELAAGAILWITARRLLPAIGGMGRAVKHLALAPAALLLILFNSLYSLFTREISWRGVRYRLHSPCQTEVLKEA